MRACYDTRMRLLILLLLLLASFAGAQQVEIIVPNSDPPLNRSILFADPANGQLILLYEKRIASPTSLVLEIRNPGTLKVIKRFNLHMRSGELFRLADFRPPHGIFAIVQSLTEVSTLKIDPATGKIQRFHLYSLEEAKKIDRTIQHIDPAGLTWNERLQKAQLLLNLPGSDRTVALLATITSAGQRDGTPSRIDSGKGEHLDLAYNTCNGELVAATDTVVRLLHGTKVLPLARPEEVAFDPSLCRYGIVRRQFTEIPLFYYLDSSLNISTTLQLPGGVAPQLIADSRNQSVYNAQRKSFIYPTWAGHQRLYINEITPAGIHTALLETPIDTASMSVASRGNNVYLLLAGLQFGTFERFHRLILVRAPL